MVAYHLESKKISPHPCSKHNDTKKYDIVTSGTVAAGVVAAEKRPTGKTLRILEEPSPTAYLREFFSKSEGGREALAYSLGTFSKPSQETTEAYDLDVVRVTRNGDIQKLRAMLSEGKTFDACNHFGESLIHMACRKGDFRLVQFFIDEAKVQVDIRDDFGRTPLHDACWTPMPNFDVMDILVKRVPPRMLLAKDIRGHTPFHYARREHWRSWVKFFQDRTNILTQRFAQASGKSYPRSPSDGLRDCT